MIIFIDTETSGLPKNYKAPVTDLDNWPRVIQLGYIATSSDGKYIHSHEAIIKPEGFEIPEEASRVHGITTEKASLIGKDLSAELMLLSNWVGPYELIVGHNITFDVNVLSAEYLRKFSLNPLFGKKLFDTMESSKEFVGIPGKYGYKWPKLSELYFKLFGKDMGEAHTALKDIENTAECYFAMVERGLA